MGEFTYGRSERIRTSDPLVPNEVRYRAALHSDGAVLYCWRKGLASLLGLKDGGGAGFSGFRGVAGFMKNYLIGVRAVASARAQR